MVPVRRPRRTKAAVEAAITDAVMAELAEVGYSALTFESVARRAQVSKPVLYRRHTSRVTLVLAACGERIAATYTEPPMTGALRTDLLWWLGRAQEQTSHIDPSTLRGLMGEAGENEMQQISALMAARLRDMDRHVLEPARRRGEIVGDIPPSVTRLFFTLSRDRALFGAPDDEDGERMVDEVILPLLHIHGAVSEAVPHTSSTKGTS